MSHTTVGPNNVSPSKIPTAATTLLKTSPRSEIYQREQILRTAEIYSLQPQEMGIDLILATVARSLRIPNVAVMMLGSKDYFLTHRLGFHSWHEQDILQLLSQESSFQMNEKYSCVWADIVVDEVKIGIVAAVSDDHIAVSHRIRLIVDEVALTISFLLNDRYTEAISQDTDLHMAQLAFLFLSMIQTPLRRVIAAREQLAESYTFLQELFHPSLSFSTFAALKQAITDREMCVYLDCFSQEIDLFRQDTRSFNFVVDAALRSMHNHVVFPFEDSTNAQHMHSKFHLGKELNNSLGHIVCSSPKYNTNSHRVALGKYLQTPIPTSAVDKPNECEELVAPILHEHVSISQFEGCNCDEAEEYKIPCPATPGCTPNLLHKSGRCRSQSLGRFPSFSLSRTETISESYQSTNSSGTPICSLRSRSINCLHGLVSRQSSTNFEAELSKRYPLETGLSVDCRAYIFSPCTSPCGSPCLSTDEDEQDSDSVTVAEAYEYEWEDDDEEDADKDSIRLRNSLRDISFHPGSNECSPSLLRQVFSSLHGVDA